MRNYFSDVKKKNEQPILNPVSGESELMHGSLEKITGDVPGFHRVQERINTLRNTHHSRAHITVYLYD